MTGPEIRSHAATTKLTRKGSDMARTPAEGATVLVFYLDLDTFLSFQLRVISRVQIQIHGKDKIFDTHPTKPNLNSFVFYLILFSRCEKKNKTGPTQP